MSNGNTVTFNHGINLQKEWYAFVLNILQNSSALLGDRLAIPSKLKWSVRFFIAGIMDFLAMFAHPKTPILSFLDMCQDASNMWINPCIF